MLKKMDPEDIFFICGNVYKIKKKATTMKTQADMILNQPTLEI